MGHPSPKRTEGEYGTIRELAAQEIGEPVCRLEQSPAKTRSWKHFGRGSREGVSSCTFPLRGRATTAFLNHEIFLIITTPLSLEYRSGMFLLITYLSAADAVRRRSEHRRSPGTGKQRRPQDRACGHGRVLRFRGAA